MLAGCICSCTRQEILSVDPVSHTESFDIWPDSIDLHSGVILRVMNDSLMEVRVNGNTLDSICASPVKEGRMSFRSSMPILDFLYRLEASAPVNSKYGAHTPYEIFLNPIQFDSAEIILRSRLKNGLVVPYKSRTLEWPAINSNAEWLLAASELAAVLGDESWGRTVETTARSLLDNDLRMSYNPSSGLFTGIPRYLAAAEGIFPTWMGSADIAAISTLQVNVDYVAAIRSLSPEVSLALNPDTLHRAINDRLWIPNMGYFSSMAYGMTTTPLPLHVTDNLAQAIAILSGQLSEPMAEKIISKTPATDMGVAPFQPMLPPASGAVRDEIGPLLRQAAWTAATAYIGNDNAYSAAVGALLALEGDRLLSARNRLPQFRSTFTTLIIRGFCGMRFQRDGIFFTPFVPRGLPGDKKITGLRYRDAILDISITGTGQAISTFTIDGTPSDPFLPGDIRGHHTITITLAGPGSDPGSYTRQAETPMAPLPPVATWTSERHAVITSGKLPASLPPSALTAEAKTQLETPRTDSHLLYLNATLIEEMLPRNYNLYDAKTPVVVQFVEIANSQLMGFSSEPYYYAPASLQKIIRAAEIASAGTKILTDKELASSFVESGKFKNRNIIFGYEAPQAGKYIVDVHYLDGLGLVNSQRKLAVRQLRINNREGGILFFPQRPPHSFPKDSVDSWQAMSAWTNSVVVDLPQGHNTLELRYFQPSPVYADPNSNTILIDRIRIRGAN